MKNPDDKISKEQLEDSRSSDRVMSQDEIASLLFKLKNKGASSNDEAVDGSENGQVNSGNILDDAPTNDSSLSETNSDGSGLGVDSPKVIKLRIEQSELDRCYEVIEKTPGNYILSDQDDSSSYAQLNLLGGASQKSIGKRAPILGIDMSPTSVKLVSIVDNIILHMDYVELDPDLDDEIYVVQAANAINLIIKRNLIKTRRAVLCISEQSSHMRILKFQTELNKNELDQTLVLESEKYYGSIENKNLELRSLSFDETVGTSEQKRLLAISSDRGAIHRAAKIAKLTKLQPLAIDIYSLAITRFYQNSYEVIPGKLTLLIQMESNGTLISFVKNKDVVWAKHISIGGRDFTKSIADTLMISVTEAEKIKVNAWEKSTSDHEKKVNVLRAMEVVLNQLVGEIQRAIQFLLTLDQKLTVIRGVLGGSGSQMVGLEQNLVLFLQIPVVRWEETGFWNTSTAVDTPEDFAERLPRYAVSLGLCLWDKTNDNINLLPKNWKSIANRKSQTSVTKSMTNRKPKFDIPDIQIGKIGKISIAVMVVIGVILGSLYQYKTKDLESILEFQKNELVKISYKKKDIDRIELINSDVVSQEKTVFSLTKNRLFLADSIIEISKITPSGILISSVEINKGKFQMAGFSRSLSVLEELMINIRISMLFANFKVITIKKSQERLNQDVRFEVTFDIATYQSTAKQRKRR